MQTKPVLLRSGALSVSIPGRSSRTLSRSAVETPSGRLRGDGDRSMIESALRHPLMLPSITDCVIPGDRVALVLEPETPLAIPLLAAVVEALQPVPDPGVRLTLLLPEDPDGEGWSSLVAGIPPEVCSRVNVEVHNPDDREQLRYLASSAGGERLYLNQHLLDADLIVILGPLCFDSRLGVRGATSAVYPHFSDRAAIELFRRDAHPELAADSPRPLRDLVDEVSWLLGTQFVAGVIPESAGSAPRILTGEPQAVLKAARKVLAESLHVKVPEPVELVAISIPGGASCGWSQLGSALEQAVRIVEPGGRIIVVADIAEPLGPAATMLRRCVEPEDLLIPLRRDPVADSREVVQLIMALRHARVYLHSSLPAAVVEELGLFPLASEDEVLRLIGLVERRLVIPNACFHRCDVAASHSAGTPGVR